MNMELFKKCVDGRCCACLGCKEKDVKSRDGDQWADVELFRIIKGRLPNQDGDDLTKSDAKKFIDDYAFGDKKLPDSSMSKQGLLKFAFHVFASSNLAYTNDTKGHGTDEQRFLANKSLKELRGKNEYE